MSLKLLHTSDRQIGKVFHLVDDGTMRLLQETRLTAITRLWELAVEHGAGHILVANDVYDMKAPSPCTLNQSLDRMRRFEKITWHPLSGNHAPYQPNNLWDQLSRRGMPDNVLTYISPEPCIFKDAGFAVLPAPLQFKRTLQDPTAYMDEAGIPARIIRIGLAHSTVRSFGPDDKNILVLTCREQFFEGLGRQNLSLNSCDTKDLTSA